MREGRHVILRGDTLVLKEYSSLNGFSGSEFRIVINDVEACQGIKKGYIVVGFNTPSNLPF